MNTQTLQASSANPMNDAAEIKRPTSHPDVDESMSEWERARQTSKTWSMEQD